MQKCSCVTDCLTMRLYVFIKRRLSYVCSTVPGVCSGICTVRVIPCSFVMCCAYVRLYVHCRCLVWVILPSLSLYLSCPVLGYWDSRTISPAHGTSWGQSMVSCKCTDVRTYIVFTVCVYMLSIVTAIVTYLCACSGTDTFVPTYVPAASWSQIWLPILGFSGISSWKCLTTSEHSSYVCFRSTSLFWSSPSAFVSSKPHQNHTSHT